MIGKIALRNFDFFWDLFKRHWQDDYGGTVFLVHPFEYFFSRDFAADLTKEAARTNIHSQLHIWGMVARRRELFQGSWPSNRLDGKVLSQAPKVDIEHHRMWWFMVRAYYNVCCLCYHRQTIEEKILVACRKFVDLKCTPKSKRALYDLLRLSKSFLLAEWVHDLIYKAVSNGDHGFFKSISNALVREQIPPEESDVAKSWFAVTLLWHLGGKEMKPLREFMNLLCRRSIISSELEEHDFRSMLSKLGLTKKLGAEN
jgi:hypothetical protein